MTLAALMQNKMICTPPDSRLATRPGGVANGG
jgi:hypothetical protein